VTGSTRMKAGTAQKLTLNALSTATMVRLGTTFGNLMIDVRPTNAKLVARTVRMLVQASGQSPQRAAEVLQAAEGSVRTALVALLSGAEVPAAREALERFPRDPHRRGDPAGIRSAVDALRAPGTAPAGIRWTRGGRAPTVAACSCDQPRRPPPLRTTMRVEELIHACASPHHHPVGHPRRRVVERPPRRPVGRRGPGRLRRPRPASA